MTTARASATRCCWPPLSSGAGRSPSPGKPMSSRAAATLVERALEVMTRAQYWYGVAFAQRVAARIALDRGAPDEATATFDDAHRLATAVASRLGLPASAPIVAYEDVPRLLANESALPVPATAPAQVRADQQQLPAYARIVTGTGEWTPVIFYRPVDCIPGSFNLLLFFDPPQP